MTFAGRIYLGREDGRQSFVWVGRFASGLERDVAVAERRFALGLERPQPLPAALPLCLLPSHGHSRDGKRSPTYHTWQNMIQRCTNPKHTAWGRYGGCGVTVCKRWRSSFEAFLEDMGERPEGTSIGRYGDAGNYEPGNVAWMTPTEQGAERRARKVGS